MVPDFHMTLAADYTTGSMLIYTLSSILFHTLILSLALLSTSTAELIILLIALAAFVVVAIVIVPFIHQLLINSLLLLEF